MYFALRHFVTSRCFIIAAACIFILAKCHHAAAISIHHPNSSSLPLPIITTCIIFHLTSINNIKTSHITGPLQIITSNLDHCLKRILRIRRSHHRLRNRRTLRRSNLHFIWLLHSNLRNSLCSRRCSSRIHCQGSRY
jgi:hypothetical protein